MAKSPTKDGGTLTSLLPPDFKPDDAVATLPADLLAEPPAATLPADLLTIPSDHPNAPQSWATPEPNPVEHPSIYRPDADPLLCRAHDLLSQILVGRLLKPTAHVLMWDPVSRLLEDLSAQVSK